MKLLNSWLGRLESVLEGVAAGALVIMMLLITIDSGGRYLFDRPLLGTQEFVEVYLMIAVVFLGMASLQAQHGNVSVEVLSRNFGPRLRRILNGVFLLLTLAVVSGIAWRAIDQTWLNFLRDRIIATPFPFTDAPMPVGYSWVIVSIATVALWLRLLLQLVTTLLSDETPPADSPGTH